VSACSNSAGPADRLDRCRAPRRVVPDDWDLCPSLANSLAAKHPILRGALVNSTVFPLMPVPGAAS
jgi:hypothetical protein